MHFWLLKGINYVKRYFEINKRKVELMRLKELGWNEYFEIYTEEARKKQKGLYLVRTLNREIGGMKK